MTKSEKSIVVKRIASELNESKNIYLTDASGLDSVQTSKLRRACFKSNIKLSVVKNTLLEKAMTSSVKEFGELDQVLKGNTALMFSEIGNAPAKVIKEFRKKVEKPLLKGASIEDAIYIGDEQLSYLADLKSKEELIGDVITILQSPAKNVISALKASGSTISGVLKVLSEKKEN
tara:strand:+ start:231 stop:755 length:525 start_codon:yes stop_codon:yes gene_type:complete